jgi:NAD(P)-dependent dehydrogenase (short-subunit alcohol dehydrogenase family)
MTDDSRTALVTGSTRGIGEAIARELVARGLRVILTGRDLALGAKLARELHATFRELDVSSATSIDAFVKWFAQEHPSPSGGLDILINNAGASFDGFDAQVARRTLDVNFVGTMHLTDALLPLLRTGSRVVMVSSGMGEVSCLGESLQKEIMSPSLDRSRLVAFADRFVADISAKTHSKNGWPSNAYRVSKVAMNAYTRILAREVRDDPRKILVNAACPGWVRTAMGGSHAPRSPEQGAKTPVWLALLPNEAGATSGGFFRDEAPIAW